MFDIKAELKKLPTDSGVYIMHGDNDEILYIGKAVNLKIGLANIFNVVRNRLE